MKPHKLSFNISYPGGNKYELIPDPELRLPTAAWRKVSRAISGETELLNCSALTLKTRWEKGMAACAVHRGEILGLTNRLCFC